MLATPLLEKEFGGTPCTCLTILYRQNSTEYLSCQQKGEHKRKKLAGQQTWHITSDKFQTALMVSEMQHIFTITEFCVPLCTRYEFFSQNNLKSVFNRPGQRSGLDSRSRLKFFRFFFNRLGCLFKCKDLIHLTSLSAVQNMIQLQTRGGLLSSWLD